MWILALAGFAATGGLEPGAAGGEKRGGSRYRFEAGDGPAQGVSYYYPQACRRPRCGAGITVRRCRVPRRKAARGGLFGDTKGRKEDRVLTHTPSGVAEVPAPVSCGGCSRYVVDRAKKVIADEDDGADGSASDDAEAGGSGVGEVERKAGPGEKAPEGDESGTGEEADDEESSSGDTEDESKVKIALAPARRGRLEARDRDERAPRGERHRQQGHGPGRGRSSPRSRCLRDAWTLGF